MPHKKKVAIAIPTQKSKLNSDDLLSLKHLEKYLYKYDKFFVIPNRVKPKQLKVQGYSFVKFPNRFFESVNTYSELMLQKDFYEKFLDYEYILIYQLDALVFSDKLIKWYNLGYDYIAPPWFSPLISSLSYKRGSPKNVGNGGFSLRKVSSAIKVLDAVEKDITRSTKNRSLRKFWFIKALISRKSHEVWLKAPADNYPFAEDGFWAIEAPKYIPDYKVAPFDKALKFGFERFPKKCFELNNKKLPFGCHAWKKYGKKFWEPFILK